MGDSTTVDTSDITLDMKGMAIFLKKSLLVLASVDQLIPSVHNDSNTLRQQDYWIHTLQLMVS